MRGRWKGYPHPPHIPISREVHLTFIHDMYHSSWNPIATNYTHNMNPLSPHASDLIRISTQFHLKENRGPIVRWMINLIIHTNTPYEALELIPDVFRFMPCDECKWHAIRNWPALVNKLKVANLNLTTELLVNEIINIQNKIILRKHLENWTKPDRRDKNTRHAVRDMEWYIAFRS